MLNRKKLHKQTLAVPPMN